MRPQSLKHRSPVYRKLQNLGAEFVEVNGYAVAAAINDTKMEAAASEALSLCDLSGLSRLGLKGPGTCRWLSTQRITIPVQSNQAASQEDNTLLVRLGAEEVLILSDLETRSRRIETLVETHQNGGDLPISPRGFIVPRQDSHIWFRLSGRKAAAMLAKLCSVDLRVTAFGQHAVAQTSVARLNAIVIRDDLTNISSYHLLADSTCAEYWWECLLDAGAEYGMRVVGLNGLQKANRS